MFILAFLVGENCTSRYVSTLCESVQTNDSATIQPTDAISSESSSFTAEVSPSDDSQQESEEEKEEHEQQVNLQGFTGL